MTLRHWWHNGIILSAIASGLALALFVAEQQVGKRPIRPLVVQVSAADIADDEADDLPGSVPATAPLFGTLAELEEFVGGLPRGVPPRPDLLHELARQARTFRAYALADGLLERALRLAPDRTDSLYLRARTQSDLGHTAKAIAMYREVLAGAPNHQRATYNLGVLLRRTGDVAGAQAVLERAVEISSGRLKSRALNQLGQVHSSRGEWGVAASTLREAVSLSPQDARFWLDLGRAEGGAGRRPAAREAFEKAIALNRKLAPAHAALAQAQRVQGERSRALASLARAVKLDGTHPEYRKSLAVLQLENGDMARARENFAWLSRNASDPGDRLCGEAMLALLNREPDKLLATVRRADAARPGTCDEAAEQAAGVLYGRKDFDTAQAVLKPLLERAAPTASVLYSAARIAARRGQWTSAESLLLKSLAADPASSESWFLLGRVRSTGLDDRAGAIDAYRKSIEANPQARSARLNLAVLYSRLGQVQDALATYNQLIGHYPRYTPALLNRALLLERLERGEEALADLEAAYRIAPEDTQVLARLAQRLVKAGDLARARELLSDAIAESPSDVDARLLLVEVQARSGQTAAATAELHRAAALAGSSTRRWERIGQLSRELGDNATVTLADRKLAEFSRNNPAPSEPADPPPVESMDEEKE